MANRMTQQSKANIQSAVEARLHETAGGITIELVGQGGRRAFVNGPETILLYGNRDLARRAVKRINPEIRITPAATI